jgi:hypothetical protein
MNLLSLGLVSDNWLKISLSFFNTYSDVNLTYYFFSNGKIFINKLHTIRAIEILLIKIVNKRP